MPHIKKLSLDFFTPEEIMKVLKKICNGKENAEKMLSKIKKRHDLMGMCKKPLVLSMVCSIINELPEDQEITQSLVYQKFSEQWLEREIDKSETETDPYFKKGKEGIKKDMNQVLKEMAVHIYKSDNILNFKKLKDYFTNPTQQEALKKLEYLAKHTGQDHASGFASRSFLSRSEDNFGFLHRSVMEYYVAEKICDELALESQQPESQTLKEVDIKFETLGFIADIIAFDSERDSKKILENLIKVINRNQGLSAKNGIALFYMVKEKLKNHAESMKANNSDKEDNVPTWEELMLNENWEECNISEAMLMNLDVSGANFSKCTAQKIQLQNTNLTNSNWESADLSDALLSQNNPAFSAFWKPSIKAKPISIHQNGNIYEWDTGKKTPKTLGTLESTVRLPAVLSLSPQMSKEISKELPLFILIDTVTNSYLQSRTHSPLKKERDIIYQSEYGNRDQLETGRNGLNLISMTPDGKFLAKCSNFPGETFISVFDNQACKKMVNIKTEAVQHLSISTDGEYLVWGEVKKGLVRKDLSTQKETSVKVGIKDISQCSAISSNGNNIFVGTSTGEIHWYSYNAESDTIEHQRRIGEKHSKAITSLAVKNDNRELLATGMDGKIQVINLQDKQTLYNLEQQLQCENMKIKGANLSDDLKQSLKNSGAIDL